MLEKGVKYVHSRRSGVFIVNFEHISHLFLVFLLLTLNKQMLAGILKISVNEFISNQSRPSVYNFTKNRTSLEEYVKDFTFFLRGYVKT